MEHETLKIALVGSVGTGKTALLQRQVSNEFRQESPATFAVDFKMTKLHSSGKVVKLHAWDTSGDSRFGVIRHSYYRNAHAVVIAFDLTRAATFDDVRARWLPEVERFSSPHVVRLLVGSKSDAVEERQVSHASALELARSFGMEYVEVSSKTGVNVATVFEKLAEQIMLKQRFRPWRAVRTLKPGQQWSFGAPEGVTESTPCCTLLPCLSSWAALTCPGWMPVPSRYGADPLPRPAVAELTLPMHGAASAA